jgi:T5SS/PEP-CTERM-associated repeat protein/autotransporter-associated beta strand protein
VTNLTGRVVSSLTSGLAATGGSATLNMTGTAANWTSAADTLIGHNGGTGTLVISDGASADDTFALVGRTAGGTGHVTVTGAGSRWMHSAGLVIGTGGSGTMLVGDGGQVANADGTIGGDAGAGGVVRVTGQGSLWASNSYLVVGLSGTGVLAVDGGGTVRVGSTGQGELTLGNAGAAAGTLNIGAAVGESALAPGMVQAATIRGGSGSGTKLVNFNHTGTAYSFAPNLTGSLSLEQNAGVTILTGSNTYSGNTSVKGGSLLVNGSIASDTVVHGGATLGGSGVIGGAVSVQDGGLLSPGNSPGQLILVDSLVLGDGATLLMEFSGTGAGQFDQLDVQGIFTAGGTLNLQLTENFTPLNGASFLIFNGVTPGFDTGSFTLTTNLGGGLAWDTSQLASAGILNVVPEPGTAGLMIGGGVLLLAARRRRRRRGNRGWTRMHADGGED